MQFFFDSFPNSSGPAQFAPAFADHVTDLVLAARTPAALALPAGARFAVFSFDGDIRVRLGAAADSLAWPEASSAPGAGSELNPAARRIPLVPEGQTPPTHLHIVAPSACAGSVSFYA